MNAGIARTLMELAVRILGSQRREWALAMRVEFEIAREEGKPLGFAFGCLIAACRELPAHEEGRYALVNHVLALALIVPSAALMVASVLNGFPSSYLGHFGIPGLLDLGANEAPFLGEANQSAVPALAMLVLLLAALNLRIAWLALESDWTRLASTGLLGAAAAITLVIFSAVVFLDPVAPLAQVAVLAAELTAAAALARWQSRLSSAVSTTPLH